MQLIIIIIIIIIITVIIILIIMIISTKVQLYELKNFVHLEFAHFRVISHYEKPSLDNVTPF